MTFPKLTLPEPSRLSERTRVRLSELVNVAEPRVRAFDNQALLSGPPPQLFTSVRQWLRLKLGIDLDDIGLSSSTEVIRRSPDDLCMDYLRGVWIYLTRLHTHFLSVHPDSFEKSANQILEDEDAPYRLRGGKVEFHTSLDGGETGAVGLEPMARQTPQRPSAPTLSPKEAIRQLRSAVERGKRLRAMRGLEHAEFQTWHAGAEHVLVQAFGDSSSVVQAFRKHVDYVPPLAGYGPADRVPKARRAACENAVHAIESSIVLLEGQIESEPQNPPVSESSKMIFIGHGRSAVWRDLRDLLKDRLDLPVDEFNRVAVAGTTTVERLEEMLDSACFAFLVMTAEDEVDAEGKARARQNVVHEVGLFQGRLGFRKAIVLLEDGCDEFSNITGLSQIRFPKGDILARSEEVRRVLQREGFIPGSPAAF
jgi:predicted nucleotide-binding protein